MSHEQTITDATLALAGHRTAQAGSLASFVSWFTSSEAGVVIGMIGVVAGLCIQWYFNRRRDKREQAEHDLKMRLQVDMLERGEKP